ncbi:MAG: RNA polymerase sigma factor, partial [Streptomyces sp.]
MSPQRAAVDPTARPPARPETQPPANTPTPSPGRPAPDRTPESAADAFELLHVRHAGSLTRQAFLLCGHRAVARSAVAHAFRRAWEDWPTVAVDGDPAGWLRAATYQYALAPWRDSRLRRRRHARAMLGVPPRDRALCEALLSLPRSYRAALLLRDGAGLSLARTAAETEASTRATAERLRHA